MHLDATFWTAVAFGILVIWLYKPVSRALKSGLDGHADKIRKELEEAQQLKEEVQAILAEYQRDQRKAVKEAEKMVEHANAEAAQMLKDANATIKEEIQRRTELATQKIAQAEASIIQDIRENALALTIANAEKIIETQLGEKESGKLLEQAIGNLDKQFH